MTDNDPRPCPVCETVGVWWIKSRTKTRKKTCSPECTKRLKYLLSDSFFRVVPVFETMHKKKGVKT